MSQTRPRTSGVRWIILALLVFASFVAYILRTNMSVAGQNLMTDLGLSQLQLGMVLAAFAWGYAIFQFPGGVFGDRIGGRRALTITAVGWAVCNLLVGLIPGPSVMSPMAILISLIALRFLMGAVQAPLYPVTGGGTISNWFPVSGWALPNGLTNTGLTLGSAATGPLIAWLMQTFGWRQSFVITAPLGLLVAATWWWYVRDNPAEHPAVSDQELALIRADRPSEPARSEERGTWKKVLANPDILALTASYFCSNYVFYLFFNWLYIYLVDSRGFQVLQGGAYSAAPWLTGAVGATVGGLLCDHLCKRIGLRAGCRWPAIVGLLLTAVFIVAAAMAQDPLTAVIFLSLCLCSQQATEGAFWAATIAVSGRHASTGCGVLNTGGNVVGGVGALLVPVVVASFGWVAALATGSIFALIAAGLWLIIHPDRMMETG